MDAHGIPQDEPVEPTELEMFLAQMLNASAEVADDYTAQVSAGLRRGSGVDEGPRERTMTPEEEQFVVERAALEEVWADVRESSAAGHLVTPDRWVARDMVPNHMDADEFAVMVFDALAAYAEGRPFEGSGIAVPVPADEDTEEPAAPNQEAPAEEASAQVVVSAEETVEAAEAPGVAASLLETGEKVEERGEPEEELVEPKALEEARSPLDCGDIVVLEGRKGAYLYARDAMSENYAHWAYLAAEDDDPTTLVDNVRQESRIYPRPMLAAAFRNPPYRWTRERTEAAFEEVQARGTYPDIARVVASNGDVYFYSTDYLSAAQAKALAQWYSVEKPLNV